MAKRQHFAGAIKGKDSVVDWNVPQINLGEQDRMRAEFWLAKQIGADLCRVYPNREWIVDADTKNEVIVISAPELSKRMGYRIHLGRDTVAQLLPRCRRAAGEILERYGVSRSKLIDPTTMEAFDRYKWDDVKNPSAEADASRI